MQDGRGGGASGGVRRRARAGGGEGPHFTLPTGHNSTAKIRRTYTIRKRCSATRAGRLLSGGRQFRSTARNWVVDFDGPLPLPGNSSSSV